MKASETMISIMLVNLLTIRSQHMHLFDATNMLIFFYIKLVLILPKFLTQTDELVSAEPGFLSFHTNQDGHMDASDLQLVIKSLI